ncbi:MAG TPA: metalloregulator ArsR/SmtB family transcription factor [Rugosimonospora sp.]|nr:metalloregulator ArsR/SmtB family transcription factor [Rugosimonospora sp.]
MDEVAGAIADPVRRDILLMLRDQPLSAGQIADRFAISRPAVSRHLRVLRQAGLVLDTPDGRRRVYTLVTAPLDELAGWLARLARPSGWQHRLDALETEVYRTRRERHTAAPRRSTQAAPRRSTQAAPRPSTQKETA